MMTGEFLLLKGQVRSLSNTNHNGAAPRRTSEWAASQFEINDLTRDYGHL